MRQMDKLHRQIRKNRFKRSVGDHQVKAFFKNQCVQVGFLSEAGVPLAEEVFIHLKKACGLRTDPGLVQAPPDPVSEDLLMDDQYFPDAACTAGFAHDRRV